jgi:hypothetical protein
MAMTSTIFAIPSVAAAGCFPGADRWLRGCAAVTSVAVGIGLAWEIGRDVWLRV